MGQEKKIHNEIKFDVKININKSQSYTSRRFSQLKHHFDPS